MKKVILMSLLVLCLIGCGKKDTETIDIQKEVSDVPTVVISDMDAVSENTQPVKKQDFQMYFSDSDGNDYACSFNEDDNKISVIYNDEPHMSDVNDETFSRVMDVVKYYYENKEKYEKQTESSIENLDSYIGDMVYEASNGEEQVVIEKLDKLEAAMQIEVPEEIVSENEIIPECMQ